MAQAVAKERHQPTLECGIEIDHQVAAREQAELGEWGVENHVVLRKQHHFPNLLADQESPAQARRRAPGEQRASRAGITTSLSSCQTEGSRKKLVTPMSISLKSRSSSCGFSCTNFSYASVVARPCTPRRRWMRRRNVLGL